MASDEKITASLFRRIVDKYRGVKEDKGVEKVDEQIQSRADSHEDRELTEENERLKEQVELCRKLFKEFGLYNSRDVKTVFETPADDPEYKELVRKLDIK